jgi:hypothetical protein
MSDDCLQGHAEMTHDERRAILAARRITEEVRWGLLLPALRRLLF